MPDPKYANLIDLAALTRFKAKNDALYATQETTDALDDRIETIENLTPQENVIETVKVNGTALTPDANKAVDVTVPTKTSDLTNDDNVVKDADYVHTDNNYTTTEKNKLAAIEATAQVNILEGVQVNSTNLTVDANKKVNVTIVEGSENGTVAVNGTDVAVHGLGSAAYTQSTAYDAAGDAAAAQAAVTGASTDAAGALTLNGLKNAIDAISGSGSGSIQDQIDTAIESIDYTVAATSGQAITGFEIEDGTLKANSVTSTSLGTAAGLNSETTLTNGSNLPTGAAITSFVADQITTALTSALVYKGVKADVASLPASGNKVGDMWHVTADSGEYAWDGSAWQEMGSIVDLTDYVEDADFSVVTNSQIDALFA